MILINYMVPWSVVVFCLSHILDLQNLVGGIVLDRKQTCEEMVLHS